MVTIRDYLMCQLYFCIRKIDVLYVKIRFWYYIFVFYLYTVIYLKQN